MVSKEQATLLIVRPNCFPIECIKSITACNGMIYPVLDFFIGHIVSLCTLGVDIHVISLLQLMHCDHFKSYVTLFSFSHIKSADVVYRLIEIKSRKQEQV